MSESPSPPPEPGAPPRPRGKARLLAGLAIALLLLLAATAGGAFVWLQGALAPVATGDREPVRFVVNKGDSAGAIARRLEREGLVRNGRLFAWLAARRGVDARLRPGDYEFTRGMTPAEILEDLGEGRISEAWVTIPEGYTLAQIAERLKEHGIPPDEFLALAENPGPLHADPALADLLPPPGKSLEGYLFPETYRLPDGADARKAIAMMLSTFGERIAVPYREQMRERGLSLHETVTLASLIEREARVRDEQPRIAAVLHNRLARGMRLQIDATVQYARGEHTARVLYRDLEIDSPYNTYRVSGLPPGPIAAPGESAVKAVLSPAPGDDSLFYVARPDGSHEFSRTYEQHLAAVRRQRAARGQ